MVTFFNVTTIYESQSEVKPFPRISDDCIRLRAVVYLKSFPHRKLLTGLTSIVIHFALSK